MEEREGDREKLINTFLGGRGEGYGSTVGGRNGRFIELEKVCNWREENESESI